MTDVKDLVAKVKRRYGEMVLNLDGVEITLKPTAEFYENFIIISNSVLDEEKKAEKLTQYFIEKFPEIVSNDLKIDKEDAKLLVINYVDKFLEALEKALGTDKKKEI